MSTQTQENSREFWVSSGHHLARRRADGRLAVTPELLLAYLARPELAPPDDACGGERALCAALRGDPLRPVAESEIAALADADARENWTFFLRYRDLLLRAGSVEDAYLALFSGGPVDLPPLFLDQMAHIVLRNALDGASDPYALRAGELFFRAQKASVRDGALLLADLELVEEQAREREALGRASPLAAMLGSEPGDDLDVMDDANAWTYWSRSDANSMVMNIGGNPAARAGLARAMSAWIEHLLRVRVTIEPAARMDDRDLRWFVGLDGAGTRIGNAIWRGQALSPENYASVACFFRLDFENRSQVEETVRGKPVWLILAMDANNVIRMKPQNLIAGLPLKQPDGTRA